MEAADPLVVVDKLCKQVILALSVDNDIRSAYYCKINDCADAFSYVCICFAS